MINFTFLSQFPVRFGSKRFQWLKADYAEGIKHRLWIVLGVSILCTLMEIILTSIRIDYLPTTIPLFADWKGDGFVYVKKEWLWKMGRNRITYIVIAAILGLFVHKHSAIVRWAKRNYGASAKLALMRMTLLFFEIAMLIITTGTAFSIVMLGFSNKVPSLFWECVFMSFPLFITFRDYRNDMKSIKENSLLTS